MANQVNDAILRLKRLGDQVAAEELPADAAVVELCKALEHRNSRVVARAAAICRNLPIKGHESLEPSLVTAYPRFLKNPVKTDPGCEAKLALLDALRIVDYTDIDFYLAAIKYEQHEPIWGGTTDTAAELRATAALALVRLPTPDLVLHLVDLLVDKEPAARAGAIRALVGSGRMEAEPLLRLKLHTGDSRPEVMGECYSALLTLSADRSLELVARRLESDNREVRNEAAIAIGESRHADAFSHLKSAFEEHTDPEDHRALALAMGLLRSEEAVAYLISNIKQEDAERAAAAIIALSHSRDLENVEDRTRAAVNACDHRYVARVFNEEFGLRSS